MADDHGDPEALLAELDAAERDIANLRGQLKAILDFEDRQDLLGHRSGRVTTHYSAAELARLLEAAESVTERIGERPELVVLRGKLGTVLPQNSRKRSTGA